MAKTDTAERNASVKRCIDEFYACFVRKFNPPSHADTWLREMAEKVPPARRSVPQEQMMLPIIHGGKDGAHFKKLVATYGEDETLRLVRQFFGTSDSRVLRSDYTVGALFALAQHLRLRAFRVADPRTADNLDAAERATQRRG